eukprot:gene16514-22740_t
MFVPHAATGRWAGIQTQLSTEVLVKKIDRCTGELEDDLAEMRLALKTTVSESDLLIFARFEQMGQGLPPRKTEGSRPARNGQRAPRALRETDRGLPKPREKQTEGFRPVKQRASAPRNPRDAPEDTPRGVPRDTPLEAQEKAGPRRCKSLSSSSPDDSPRHIRNLRPP